MKISDWKVLERLPDGRWRVSVAAILRRTEVLRLGILRARTWPDSLDDLVFEGQGVTAVETPPFGEVPMIRIPGELEQTTFVARVRCTSPGQPKEAEIQILLDKAFAT